MLDRYRSTSKWYEGATPLLKGIEDKNNQKEVKELSKHNDNDFIRTLSERDVMDLYGGKE